MLSNGLQINKINKATICNHPKFATTNNFLSGSFIFYESEYLGVIHFMYCNISFA